MPLVLFIEIGADVDQLCYWMSAVCNFRGVRLLNNASGALLHQPGYCGAIAEVGLQFAVGVAQERPLAGQAPDPAGQIWIVGQVPVPQVTVLGSGDVKQAQAIWTCAKQSHVRGVDGGIEEERFASGRQCPHILQCWSNNLITQVFCGNVHNATPRRDD
jgi:hypothetical protein